MESEPVNISNSSVVRKKLSHGTFFKPSSQIVYTFFVFEVLLQLKMLLDNTSDCRLLDLVTGALIMT